MSLEEEFPLLVHYPKGGEHFLLLWSANNTGTHCLISQKEASINSSLSIISKKVGVPSLKEYWKVNMVSPTEKLKTQAAEYCRSLEISSFQSALARDLFLFVDRETHPKITSCTNYWNKYDSLDDEDNSLKEENDVGHLSCANCFDKVIIKGYDIKSLFNLLKDKYKDSIVKFRKDSKMQVSQAPSADPAKDIFYIDDSAFSGVHCKIVNEFSSLQNITFFFQGIKLPVPQHLILECKRMKEVLDCQAKKNREIAVVNLELEAQKKVEKIKAFLDELP